MKVKKMLFDFVCFKNSDCQLNQLNRGSDKILNAEVSDTIPHLRDLIVVQKLSTKKN